MDVVCGFFKAFVEAFSSSLTVTVTCDLLLLLVAGLVTDPYAVYCALLPVFERCDFAFSSTLTLDMVEAANDLDSLDVRCDVLSWRWRFAEG